MSSAHTENLPADLNEHNEELADGCDNADTYLSAFYLFFFFLSLFKSAFVMMRNEFLRKRRKEILVIIIIEIDDSLARMKRDDYLLFLRVARHFSFTEKRFFSRKNVCFLRFSRGRAKFFFPRSTHRAQVSSLFGGSMILVKKRYDFGWLFNLKKKERFGCRVLLTSFTLIFFPMY